MGNYFQILEQCSSDLGNCCSDYALANILDILRQFLSIIQIVVPIILIVMVTVQFVKMVVAPDDKKSTKSLINKFIAAAICFLLPALLDLVLGIIPESGLLSSAFNVSACWEAAKVSKEEIQSTTFKYLSTSDRKPKDFLTSEYIYDNSNSNSNGSSNGSPMGKKIVNTALDFVPGKYCIGGKDPNVCADCSGFVQYVFKQHGFNLPGSTASYDINSSMFTQVNDGNIKAGDIVLYTKVGQYGHVGILTGNGEEIVHASSDKEGIKKSPTYKYRTIRAVLRVKGVN